MLNILDEMAAQGLDPADTSLEIGIFGAEPWTNEMRREIESRGDMHAVDIYGLSEVIGPGVANECIETKDGLHVWEDHFYPRSSIPRPATSARRRVRRARLHLADQGGLSGHPLPHPRPHAAAARHGALDAPHGEDHRALRRHADHPRRQRVPDPDRGDFSQNPRTRPPLPARALPRRPSRRLRVHCELVAGAGPSVESARAGAAARLARATKELIGISVEPVVHDPGLVARSEGKAKRVVDNRKPA
jgi:phenylacetate-CoA ligase